MSPCTWNRDEQQKEAPLVTTTNLTMTAMSTEAGSQETERAWGGEGGGKETVGLRSEPLPNH